MRIDPIVSKNVDDVMESTYGHFLSFEETRSFFPDKNTLNRARSAQADYFRRLTKGDYGQRYVENRLRVGSTHYHIDLDPKWYIGSYNRALSWLLPLRQAL